MKCSLGISNVLEEISSLSHSIVFPLFLCTDHWGRLSYLSLLFFWNSAFKRVYLSFSPLLFASLLFTDICKAFSDSHFGFLHFFFLEMVLLPVSCTMHEPHSIVHPYSRKWRTKEPLDKSEKEEWKSWLKVQHSENKDYGIHSHPFIANRWRIIRNSGKLYFEGLKNHCRWWLQPWN